MSSLSSPDSTPTQPRGYKGPRGAILVELKKAKMLVARELAQKLGISLNAVRHHLKELEADGLVTYRRERRGVGAPTFAYDLSTAGEALFPHRYEETLTELLEQVATQQGREVAVNLLRARYEELARQLKRELEGSPAGVRMARVAQARVDDGYMAEWEGVGEGYLLTEHNCAILSVAERFPEICAVEHKFLEEVLGARVEREAHILRGCHACGYHVTFGPGQGGSEGAAKSSADAPDAATGGAETVEERL